MSAQDTIGGILQRDLSRRIEEVIKLDQADDETVYGELTDYVVTPMIRDAYRRVLRAVADAPGDPPESVGVWVSGFFGSGKSSFAKNLGYALEDRSVAGHRAGELLMKQVEDTTCRDYLALIHARTPTEVVMFDVNLDRSDAGHARALSISHYLYRNLLRHLGYSDVLEVAELEFTLEEQGQLADFVAHFEGRLRKDWEIDSAKYREALDQENWRWTVRRDKADALSLASTRLFELYPQNYPTPDHLLQAVQRRPVEVSPKFLVDRSFAMMARRRPGKALAFVVDEVGGYVARSLERIEDLRVVVEHFGKAGKNAVKAHKAVGPTWLVVTSQEKLDAVVDYLDSKRVEIARLQDRFPQTLRVDLAPAEIQEVVSRRLLAKTPPGEATLRALYESKGPEIAERLRLEKTKRDTTLDAVKFAKFYPYPPHFLDLSIEVVNGLRLQDHAGNSTTAGGSNRTLIRQAYAMLTMPPRDGGASLKDLPVGQMVTLDRVFDLVWSNLSSEQQREILDVQGRFKETPWPMRVAKVLCLLQQVRDLPRTEVNIAALLWDGLGQGSALDAVRSALQVLKEANFVRLGDDGWTLQNQSEKAWSVRKRSIDPRPGARADRLREVVRKLFDEEPSLGRYTYKSLRTLKIGITMDDHDLAPGQLPLHLVTADSEDVLAGTEGLVARIWTRSQESSSRDRAYWIWARTPRVDELVAQLLQSEILVKQEEPRVHGRTPDVSELKVLIEQERAESGRLLGLVQAAVKDALGRGQGVFRGVQRSAADLGNDLPTALGAFLEQIVPQLYPHLEAGAKLLKGTEAEDALKSATLTGLPEVFYAPPKGLDLVVQKDQRWVVNPEAPVAKLVLAHLRAKHGYGEKVTGKSLEAEFTGVGYAWDVEVLQVVLAALLRGGHVEMVHQGVRFQATLASDPRARAPFNTKPAFRAASFAPRTTPGTKLLVKAANQFEQLAGEEVDIEEGAIAEAFKAKVVRPERERITPALAVARALALPITPELEEQAEWWRNVEQGASDDTVKLLAEEGAALADRRQRLTRLTEALRTERVGVLQRARVAVERLAPEILVRDSDAKIEATARSLREALEQGGWIDEPQRLADLTIGIETRHEELAEARRREVAARREVATQALRTLATRERVPEARQDAILALFDERPIAAPAVAGAQPTDAGPRGTVSLDALDAALRTTELRASELQEAMLRVAQPDRKTARVRALPKGSVMLEDAEDVEEFVTRLRKALLDALGTDGTTLVVLE